MMWVGTNEGTRERRENTELFCHRATEPQSVSTGHGGSCSTLDERGALRIRRADLRSRLVGVGQRRTNARTPKPGMVRAFVRRWATPRRFAAPRRISSGAPLCVFVTLWQNSL